MIFILLKLTLIVGAICTDGVVIVGDTKLTDTMGTLLRYEPKLAGVLRNVIFGYAGAVVLYKVFERYLAGDVIILRDSPEKYTSHNLLKKQPTQCMFSLRLEVDIFLS
jgi:20S proteasome alpha/beta subunit